MVLQHGRDLQAHILRVHLGAELVIHALALAGGNDNGVFRRCQITQDLRLTADILQEGPADDEDADRFGLGIGDIQHDWCRFAIDELHAEDLGLRELGLDGDFEVGRLGLLVELFDRFDLGWGSAVGALFTIDVIMQQHVVSAVCSFGRLRQARYRELGSARFCCRPQCPSDGVVPCRHRSPGE